MDEVTMDDVRVDTRPGLMVTGLAANQASPGGQAPCRAPYTAPSPLPRLRHEETPSNWHPSTQIGP